MRKNIDLRGALPVNPESPYDRNFQPKPQNIASARGFRTYKSPIVGPRETLPLSGGPGWQGRYGVGDPIVK